MPPPTVNNNANSLNALGPDEEDDGQYREDPSIYWKDPKYNNGVRNVASKAAAPAPVNYNYNVNAAPKQQYFENSVTPAPAYRQPAVYQPEPRYQPAYNPEPYYQRRSEPVYSHPAIQQFDINSGSYTINYSG